AREHYEAIGGGSPLRKRTQEQAEALERMLREHTGAEVFVRMGMRYWYPFTRDTIEEFRQMNINDVFLLPLYPHYSVTSSGSSFRDWKKLHNEASKAATKHATDKKLFRVRSTKDFYLQQSYIAAVSQTIDEGIQKFTEDERKSLHLLFSAHGTPASIAEKGDPYQRQIKATIDAVMQYRKNDHPHSLSYQSRVGPAKWLKPYTTETLQSLGAKNTKNVLVIPISFVSDHVETLFELNIEVREIAEKAGITHYEVTPGLNARAEFIRALTEIVVSRYNVK
ncbi:MAG TPA: ferrochelatase, partial [Candidatus Kapabacteria bacterium]|nr:ferrochelatase [Candidatus Kapabacteria bacterium]